MTACLPKNHAILHSCWLFFFSYKYWNALCTIRRSKKDKSCLLMDKMIINFCYSTPAAKHSPLCSANSMCVPLNNVVWFLYKDHLHMVAIKTVKVAFNFSSYLTHFPFNEVSLVFVFFWGDNYCLLVPIQFTVSMHLLVFCINFMGLIGC